MSRNPGIGPQNSDLGRADVTFMRLTLGQQHLSDGSGVQSPSGASTFIKCNSHQFNADKPHYVNSSPRKLAANFASRTYIARWPGRARRHSLWTSQPSTTSTNAMTPV